eukprot:6586982-Alexandrium_andersonii.AAC.1
MINLLYLLCLRAGRMRQPEVNRFFVAGHSKRAISAYMAGVPPAPPSPHPLVSCSMYPRRSVLARADVLATGGNAWSAKLCRLSA